MDLFFFQSPCTRGSIADDFVFHTSHESKMVPAVSLKVGDLIKTKNPRKGLYKICALKIDRLKKTDFTLGFSLLSTLGVEDV